MSQKETVSEKEMVAGCIRNDRYYQEMLYRHFFPAMLRMCMRYTQDRDIAMEIINTGFLKVFRKLHTFSFAGSLEGWIRKLVFHSLSDHYKKYNRNVHLLSIEDRDAPISNAALGQLYLEDLMKLVEQLPDATKRVFVLYAIEGYTHEEIGAQLDISSGTSKWHLATARKKLKKWINEQANRNQYAG